jgi:serine/threonine protein kinase
MSDNEGPTDSELLLCGAVVKQRTLEPAHRTAMAPPQADSKFPVGTELLGKYRITREIGRGGMASVYEAEQLALGKRVAIKILAAELAGSSVVIERFFREARAAASVKSPHIVDIYDSGRLEDGRPFITMELLEGESLYDRMARVRLIDAEMTVRVITHCAKGLMKAHEAGIVHRDLKPENIFLMQAEDGDVAKILDFGLAKFYAPVAGDQKAVRLTREGAVFGTPAYMSPEQVKGQGSVDHRADLWALGCMAYECLVGRPVWNTDQGVAMTFAAIAAATPPVPSRMRPSLPAAFDEWFKKALQRDPNKRFQTAKELAEDLERALLPKMTPGEELQSDNIEIFESVKPPPGRLAPPPEASAPNPFVPPNAPARPATPAESAPSGPGSTAGQWPPGAQAQAAPWPPQQPAQSSQPTASTPQALAAPWPPGSNPDAQSSAGVPSPMSRQAPGLPNPFLSTPGVPQQSAQARPGVTIESLPPRLLAAPNYARYFLVVVVLAVVGLIGYALLSQYRATIRQNDSVGFRDASPPPTNLPG